LLYFVINVVVWALLFFLLVRAVNRLDWLIHHFSSGWLAALIFAVCFALFYVRLFFRLAYAGLEITIGIVLVLDVIQGGIPDPTKIDEPTIKIAAGMYLVIRGIDNCMHWLAPKLERCPAWVRYIFRSG
jgi:hypothetical protein